MNGHLAPHAGRLRWKLRGFWPDRNPLRRHGDRVEAAVVAGLLAVFLIGGTLAAVITGRWAYESALRARQAELAKVHQVTAVLLTAASQSPASFDGTAEAWWRAPDGARRTGQVWVPAASAAGTRVTLWVDAAGWQAAAPLRPEQVEGQGVLASALAVMTVVAMLGSAWLAVHCAANRRRMAAWDEEWRATGPRWSHHG